MRLSSIEVQHIIKAISPFVKNNTATLHLYGSRVDDAKKGGDIDLLLIFESQKQSEALISEKHKLLAEIKYLIGDQKIDLKITHRQAITNDHFLQMIIPTSIILHQW